MARSSRSDSRTRELKDLRKQVEKGGWHDVETEDGDARVYLGKVAFLRVDSGEGRVGF